MTSQIARRVIQQRDAQVRRLGALQQVAVGAGFEREKHQFLVIHGGENDDLRLRQ